MTVSKKIKTIDNKTEQNKAQHNLDQQTVKISALSSRNMCRYECLAGNIYDIWCLVFDLLFDVLPEKELSKDLNIHH